LEFLEQLVLELGFLALLRHHASIKLKHPLARRRHPLLPPTESRYIVRGDLEGIFAIAPDHPLPFFPEELLPGRDPRLEPDTDWLTSVFRPVAREFRFRSRMGRLFIVRKKHIEPHQAKPNDLRSSGLNVVGSMIPFFIP